MESEHTAAETEAPPRWVALVEGALVNTNRLGPASLGALVSLTYNRGASNPKLGDRYRVESRDRKGIAQIQRVGARPEKAEQHFRDMLKSVHGKLFSVPAKHKLGKSEGRLAPSIRLQNYASAPAAHETANSTRAAIQ